MTLTRVHMKAPCGTTFVATSTSQLALAVDFRVELAQVALHELVPSRRDGPPRLGLHHPLQQQPSRRWKRSRPTKAAEATKAAERQKISDKNLDKNLDKKRAQTAVTLRKRSFS